MNFGKSKGGSAPVLAGLTCFKKRITMGVREKFGVIKSVLKPDCGDKVA